MRSSPSAPAWAVELTLAVCLEAGVPPPARLAWREWSGMPSTGSTRPSEGVVAVVAGLDAGDQRLTLLHELAHWLTPAGRRRGRATHHGAAFYAVAFPLYARHGLSPAEALAREALRYPSALRHAAGLGVPGAASALAERRAQLRARPRASWRVLVPEHAIRLERDGRWTRCAVCRQRIVGLQLARLRRGRRPRRHVLLTLG